MTTARINHFTTWLLSIALIWTAVIAVGVTGAFAEDTTLYRYTGYTVKKQSVVVRFQADTGKKKKLRLSLPLELRQGQTIVDGMFSRRTGLLAAMTDTRPSVFDFTMTADLKRVRRIEERNPTDQDKNFFTGLLAGSEASSDAAKGDDGVVRVMAQEDCLPGQTWGITGYETTYEQKCQGQGKPCIWVPVRKPVYGCIGTPSSPPPPKPPTNPHPPSNNPCPGPGNTYFCGSLTRGYTCCDLSKQRCVIQSGIGFCEDPTPPPQPQCPGNDGSTKTKVCGNTSRWTCCEPSQICRSGGGVGPYCDDPPQPPQPQCPGNYGPTKTKVCGNNSIWTCCEPSQTCRSAVGGPICGDSQPPSTGGPSVGQPPSDPVIPVIPNPPGSPASCRQNPDGSWNCPNKTQTSPRRRR